MLSRRSGQLVRLVGRRPPRRTTANASYVRLTSFETKLLSIENFTPCVILPLQIVMTSESSAQQLATTPKPTGNGVPDPEVVRAKRILQQINDLSGVDDHADGIPPPRTAQEPLPTVRAVKADTLVSRAASLSTSRAQPRQPSSKGDEFMSKLTNYLEERSSSSSSSSSSGLNPALILITSQNNELRGQNTELRSQVDRYRMEVDRLEKKLEKFRKKADMTELVARFTSHSISPRPSSALGIAQHMSTPSVSERMDFSPINSSPLQVPPPAINPISQVMAPTIGEGAVEGVVEERVIRFCPDGSEVWYPGSDMPGDHQLNVLNSFWSPFDNRPSLFDDHPSLFDNRLSLFENDMSY